MELLAFLLVLQKRALTQNFVLRTRLSQELTTSLRLVIKVKCNSQVILYDSVEVPSDVVVVDVVNVEGFFDKPNGLEIPSQIDLR